MPHIMRQLRVSTTDDTSTAGTVTSSNDVTLQYLQRALLDRPDATKPREV